MALLTAPHEYSPLDRDPVAVLTPFEQTRLEVAALDTDWRNRDLYSPNLVSDTVDMAGRRLKVATMIVSGLNLEYPWEPRIRRSNYKECPTLDEYEWCELLGIGVDTPEQVIEHARERDELRELISEVGDKAIPAYDDELVPVVTDALRFMRDHSANRSALLETSMALAHFETPRSVRRGYVAQRIRLACLTPFRILYNSKDARVTRG